MAKLGMHSKIARSHAEDTGEFTEVRLGLLVQVCMQLWESHMCVKLKIRNPHEITRLFLLQPAGRHCIAFSPSPFPFLPKMK